MSEKTYRHELKHYINAIDAAVLRSRLRHIAKPDPHGDIDGRYQVRSLYFDNYADKVITDKLSGQSRREKFRLRYYGDDISLIRLEKKSKINKGCVKESQTLTPEQCQRILNGGLSHLPEESPLLAEYYAKSHFQQIKPRNIVDYTREAFIFKAGNVRITIDSDIRTSHHVADFLNPGLPTIPAARAIILEIKYDDFLPDIIRCMIQLDNRNQTEFSKYVVARLV